PDITSSATRSASCSKASFGSPMRKPADGVLSARVGSPFRDNEAWFMASIPALFHGPLVLRNFWLPLLHSQSARHPASIPVCDVNAPTRHEFHGRTKWLSVASLATPPPPCPVPVAIHSAQCGQSPGECGSYPPPHFHVRQRTLDLVRFHPCGRHQVAHFH